MAKTNEDWEEVNASTWSGFEKAYKDGKLRAIGLCNFEKKHLDSLLARCEIAPMLNQIEYHPGYIRQDTLDYSKANNMLVEAFYPLGSGKLLARDDVKEMALRYGKTPAQVLLRFSIQSGCIPLVKSVHKERIIENTKAFDFELAEEDMNVLRNVEHLTAFSGWVAEEAPADAIVEAQKNNQ